MVSVAVLLESRRGCASAAEGTQTAGLRTPSTLRTATRQFARNSTRGAARRAPGLCMVTRIEALATPSERARPNPQGGPSSARPASPSFLHAPRAGGVRCSSLRLRLAPGGGRRRVRRPLRAARGGHARRARAEEPPRGRRRAPRGRARARRALLQPLRRVTRDGRHGAADHARHARPVEPPPPCGSSAAGAEAGQARNRPARVRQQLQRRSVQQRLHVRRPSSPGREGGTAVGHPG